MWSFISSIHKNIFGIVFSSRSANSITFFLSSGHGRRNAWYVLICEYYAGNSKLSVVVLWCTRRFGSCIYSRFHATVIIPTHLSRLLCYDRIWKLPNNKMEIWSDSERASSLICGNKMPTRCKRWFLLQILLFAQHVSGTIMPIIRSSRVVYRWLLPVVFGALVFKLSVWCGAEGCVSGLRAAARHTDNLKTKHQIRQAAATCIILSSSWWWA